MELFDRCKTIPPQCCKLEVSFHHDGGSEDSMYHNAKLQSQLEIVLTLLLIFRTIAFSAGPAPSRQNRDVLPRGTEPGRLA